MRDLAYLFHLRDMGLARRQVKVVAPHMEGAYDRLFREYIRGTESVVSVQRTVDDDGGTSCR